MMVFCWCRDRGRMRDTRWSKMKRRTAMGHPIGRSTVQSHFLLHESVFCLVFSKTLLGLPNLGCTPSLWPSLCFEVQPSSSSSSSSSSSTIIQNDMRCNIPRVHRLSFAPISPSLSALSQRVAAEDLEMLSSRRASQEPFSRRSTAASSSSSSSFSRRASYGGAPVETKASFPSIASALRLLPPPLSEVPLEDSLPPA